MIIILRDIVIVVREMNGITIVNTAMINAILVLEMITSVVFLDIDLYIFSMKDAHVALKSEGMVCLWEILNMTVMMEIIMLMMDAMGNVSLKPGLLESMGHRQDLLYELKFEEMVGRLIMLEMMEESSMEMAVIVTERLKEDIGVQVEIGIQWMYDGRYEEMDLILGIILEMMETLILVMDVMHLALLNLDGHVLEALLQLQMCAQKYVGMAGEQIMYEMIKTQMLVMDEMQPVQ